MTLAPMWIETNSVCRINISYANKSAPLPSIQDCWGVSRSDAATCRFIQDKAHIYISFSILRRSTDFARPSSRQHINLCCVLSVKPLCSLLDVFVSLVACTCLLFIYFCSMRKWENMPVIQHTGTPCSPSSMQRLKHGETWSRKRLFVRMSFNIIEHTPAGCKSNALPQKI